MPSQTWTTSCSRTSLVRPAAMGPSKTDVCPCSDRVTLMSLLSSLRLWESALKQSKHEVTRYFKAVLQNILTAESLSFHPLIHHCFLPEVAAQLQKLVTANSHNTLAHGQQKLFKKSSASSPNHKTVFLVLVFIPIKFQDFFSEFYSPNEAGFCLASWHDTYEMVFFL